LRFRNILGEGSEERLRKAITAHRWRQPNERSEPKVYRKHNLRTEIIFFEKDFSEEYA